MQITFTPIDLKRYLDGLAPGEIAGDSGYESSCPIAQCVKRQYGVDDVNVAEYAIYFDGEPVCHLAGWAQDFVSRIDHIEGYVPVTKEQAQQILQECL